VVDALSRINCFLHTTSIEVLVFDRLKDAYSSYPDFGIAYSKLLACNRQPYVDFVLHDNYLLRGSQPCIPRTSFRDSLVR